MQVNVSDYIVDKNKKNDVVLEEICYSIGMKEVGSQIEKKDNPLCFCKMLIYRKSDPSFYIKADAYGNFLDPWGINTETGALMTYQRNTGNPALKYVRVSDEVFHTYLRFLQTRNNLHYRKAKTEYLNTT